jgi:hypothetical protein
MNVKARASSRLLPVLGQLNAIFAMVRVSSRASARIVSVAENKSVRLAEVPVALKENQNSP